METLTLLFDGLAIGVALVLVVSWLWRRRRKVYWELRRFLRADPNRFEIATKTFATVDLPNLQLAIESIGRSVTGQYKTIGYSSQFGDWGADLRTMLRKDVFNQVKLAPVLRREVDIDVDRRLPRVENGIHLITLPIAKIAAHVRSDKLRHGDQELEVLADTAEIGSRFIERVRNEIAQTNVYRGKVLSLECDSNQWGGSGCANVRFHRLPAVSREEIILPPETLNLIERNTVGFFQKADTLRQAGRSVKRGILLHGKRGTGKTYTAKWLAGALEGVTVILLSGDQLWLIKQCCQMARMLAPSLVVLEDVDLIATARDEHRHPMYQITLHQLLNEMDGLAGDASVIFLLTSNRPDVLEHALAARPGRVDQAIEYPLPDAECRRRLLELYSRGLDLNLRAIEPVVARTEGASPAFIQELVRKASLIAAEEGSQTNGQLSVTDRHLDQAVHELLFGGGELTRNLFGFTRAPSTSPTPLPP